MGHIEWRATHGGRATLRGPRRASSGGLSRAAGCGLEGCRIKLCRRRVEIAVQ